MITESNQSYLPMSVALPIARTLLPRLLITGIAASMVMLLLAAGAVIGVVSEAAALVKLGTQTGHYFVSSAIALSILTVTTTYRQQHQTHHPDLPLLVLAFIGSSITGALWKLLGPAIFQTGVVAGELAILSIRFDLLANTFFASTALWTFERSETHRQSNDKSINYTTSLLTFFWSKLRSSRTANHQQPIKVLERINAK